MGIVDAVFCRFDERGRRKPIDSHLGGLDGDGLTLDIPIDQKDGGVGFSGHGKHTQSLISAQHGVGGCLDQFISRPMQQLEGAIVGLWNTIPFNSMLLRERERERERE